MTPQEEADLYRARDRERRLAGVMSKHLTDEEVAKVRSLIAVRSEKGAPWTSVQFSPPPCAGHYLVFCPGLRPWIQRFTAQGRFIGGMRDDITHWMCLPSTEELPKE